jgi:hypothetical protein
MISIRQRPLTPQERSDIRQLRSRRELLRAFVSEAGCVTLLLLAPALWVLNQLGLDGWRPLAAGLALIIGSGLALKHGLRMRETVPSGVAYRKDLQGGLAEERTYEVSDAIKVEEYEDLGPNYYLKLTSGQILFLSGQYLYEPEEGNRFPCTRVRRTVAPHSSTLLGFECLGNYFAPSSTRPAFAPRQYRS